MSLRSYFLSFLFVGILAGCSNEAADTNGANVQGGRSIELLNVSYDPTRELWRDINEHFIPAYEKESGNKLTINQSHGGSSTQARSIIDGLEGDVVTLASFLDTQAISERGLIAPHWISEFPNNSLPYYSTIVFV